MEVGNVVLECGSGYGNVYVTVVAVVVRVDDVHARHGVVGVGARHDDLGVNRREGLSAYDAGELLDQRVMSANNVGANAASECVGSVRVLVGVAMSLPVVALAVFTTLEDDREIEP